MGPKETQSKFSIFLSLIGTPLLLFISSPVSLYLKNHEEFNDSIEILYPFFALFIFTYILGIFLFYFFKDRGFKYPIWMYFCCMPLLFCANLLNLMPISGLAKIILLMTTILFSIGLLLYYNKKFKLGLFVKIFSVLSTILLTTQVVLFLPYFWELHTKVELNTSSVQAQVVNKEMHNIYHIVLDEFQTDMFLSTLTPNIKNKLGGFTFFPETTTIYGRTGMSLASIMTGVSYNYETPQINYEWDAFNSNKSILFWLKKAGYQTTAYIHPVYDFKLKLFDNVYNHSKNAEVNSFSNYRTLFFHLWIYANFPEPIAKKFISQVEYEQFKNQNMLTDAAPVLSQKSFINLMEKEHMLGDHNRYTFIHLLIPHFPYVLSADGTYHKNGTTPEEQSKYATNLIINFIESLKKMGRFEQSLIIIQSDHGARFELKDKRLINIENKGTFSEEWSKARSRSLLLVKPAGRSDSNDLTVSNVEATLLDIAPTIAKSIKLAALNFEGTSLIGNEHTKRKRERYYHFYEKKGPNEWTDEMSRYIVKKSQIIFDKKISLRNNPRDRVVDISQLINYSLPKETNNIQYFIDYFGVKKQKGKSYIQIRGWAFIKGQSSNKSSIYLVLKSNENNYIFKTNVQQRADVTNHFKKLNVNLDDSGFTAAIPKEVIKKGTYSVGIFIKKGDVKALQYTDQTITK